MEGYQPPVPALRLNSLPMRSFSIRSSETLPATEFDSSKLPKYNDFTSLGRLLRRCMSDQAGIGTGGGEGFLPPVPLSTILHKEAIEYELRKEDCRLDLAKMTNIILGPLAEDGDESAEENKSYLLVLAILALLDKVCDVEHFLDDNDGGIWDGDLPLKFHNGDDGSLELWHRSTSKSLHCFKKWKDSDHLSFNNYQWRLLVPTFVFNDDKI